MYKLTIMYMLSILVGMNANTPQINCSDCQFSNGPYCSLVLKFTEVVDCCGKLTSEYTVLATIARRSSIICGPEGKRFKERVENECRDDMPIMPALAD